VSGRALAIHALVETQRRGCAGRARAWRWYQLFSVSVSL